MLGLTGNCQRIAVAHAPVEPCPMSPPEPDSERGRWLWRRTDQLLIAILNLVALLAIGGYWLQQGGQQGRLIEIDRARPRRIEFRVDINRADWAELSQLPQIGETLAKRIVESREQDGPFRSWDDLQRVRGIGPRTLAGLRPYLAPIAADEQLVGNE